MNGIKVNNIFIDISFLKLYMQLDKKVEKFQNY